MHPEALGLYGGPPVVVYPEAHPGVRADGLAFEDEGSDLGCGQRLVFNPELDVGDAFAVGWGSVAAETSDPVEVVDYGDDLS